MRKKSHLLFVLCFFFPPHLIAQDQIVRQMAVWAPKTGSSLRSSVQTSSAATTSASLAIEQPEQFATGWNHPWTGYGHDFGKNAWGHDGVITSGWSYQTYIDSQGFTDTRRVQTSNCSGRPTLRIAANLMGGHPNKSSGEIELAMMNHSQRSGTLPLPVPYLNLEGVTVRVRVWLPMGSAGPANARNGIQLLFKTRLSDTNYSSLYSPWQNINPAWEGNCIEVTALVSNTGPGDRYGPFDATKVSIIGLKLGINRASTAQINGFLYMESYKLATDPPFTYDFDQLEFEKDFLAATTLTSGQLSLARVFVFADGRAGPEFTGDGSVSGFDEYFFEDFDELLRIAERTRTKIIPVLLDFPWCARAATVAGVQLGGHADVIKNTVKRQTFLDNALRPMLQRYGNSPWIHSWDVINEPEWVMAGVSGIMAEGFDPEFVGVAEMQDFVRAVASYVHSYTVHPVTVGSARRMWLQLWRTTGLDLYQFHWYDSFESIEPFPFRPYSELGLDKPCLIGEVPTASTKYRAGQFLEAARTGGYSGLLLWSFRAGDVFSNFAVVAADLMKRARIGVFGSGSWYLDLNGDGRFDAGDRFARWGSAWSIPVVGDWNGDGRTKIGAFGGGFFYLDYNGNGVFDAQDRVIGWGRSTSTPVVGDWNGDGRTKIGIFDGGFWYLDTNGNGLPDSTDCFAHWGDATSIPVVGDWNGDGRAKIGAFGGGFFYLDYNGNCGFDTQDKVIGWGSGTSTPVVGDWNGNRRTKIGIFEGGFWYLDTNGNGLLDAGDMFANYGVAGSTPIVGDWNADGKTKIGAYGSSYWFLDANGNGVFDGADRVFGFGQPADTPLVGRW